MKRCMSLLVVMLLLFCGVTVEASGGAIITPQYSYTTQISAGLSISGGTAYCFGEVRGTYNDTFTLITVILQKRAIGGSTWTQVASWSSYAPGRYTAAVEEEKSVSSGYDYRVYVLGTISDDEGLILEQTSKYSSIVRY